MREWGVSHATLEEVFLEVSKRYGFSYEEVEEEGVVADSQKINLEHVAKETNSYPYRALFRKNFSLQLRQKGSNFCQIITPLLVMGLLILLQV